MMQRHNPGYERHTIPIPYGYTNGFVQSQIQLITAGFAIIPGIKLSSLLLKGISNNTTIEALSWMLALASIQKLMHFSKNNFGARSFPRVMEAVGRHQNLLAHAQRHGITMFNSRQAVQDKFKNWIANNFFLAAAATAVIFYMQDPANHSASCAGLILAAICFLDLVFTYSNKLGATALNIRDQPQQARMDRRQ